MNPMSGIRNLMKLCSGKILEDGVFILFLDVTTFTACDKIGPFEKDMLKQQFANDLLIGVFDGFQIAFGGVSTPGQGLNVFE